MSDIRKAIMARLGEFARPGAKAEMGTVSVNTSASTADLLTEVQRLRDKIKTSGSDFDKSLLEMVKKELERRGVAMMSRFGAKAEMAKWTVVMPSIPDAGTRHFDSWEQAKKYVDSKMGGFTALVSVDGKRYALKHALGQWEKFSRPGEKAEMRESLQAMWDGKQWKVNTPSGAAWYSEDGKRWTKKHGEPVTPAEVRQYAIKLGTGFSRPGAKAEMAYGVPNAFPKFNKGDMVADSVHPNRKGKIVQVIPGRYDAKSYTTAENEYIVDFQPTAGLVRYGEKRLVRASRPGAKAEMGYSTIRKVTTTDVAGGGTWRKTMEKYGTKKAAVMTYTNNGQVGQVYQDPDNPSVFKAFDMDGRELGSGSEADMKRKVESLAFAKTGSKSTHASLWNRFTVVLRSKRTGNRFLWNTEAKNEADAKDNAYALYGDAYEVIEVAMRPSRPGAKSTNALSDACWQGYEAVGTKKQDGKTVPNCVPKATAAKPVETPAMRNLNRKMQELTQKADRLLRQSLSASVTSEQSQQMQDEVERISEQLDAMGEDLARQRKAAGFEKPSDLEREDVKAGLKLMEKADEKVSDKIRTLIKEGKPQDQAVAIALDMKRRGEL